MENSLFNNFWKQYIKENMIESNLSKKELEQATDIMINDCIIWGVINGYILSIIDEIRGVEDNE